MESRQSSAIHSLDEVSQNDTHTEGARCAHEEVHESEGGESIEACPEGLCDGSGEVVVDVEDGDSHQIMRGVGTQKCLCQTKKQIDRSEE